MADTGRKRGEIADEAFEQILSEAIAKRASIIRIFLPENTINALTSRAVVLFLTPKCMDDMIGLIKTYAKLSTKNKGVEQIGNMEPRWRREFFLPLYVMVKVVPRKGGSEEVRLYVA